MLEVFTVYLFVFNALNVLVGSFYLLQDLRFFSNELSSLKTIRNFNYGQV